MGTALHRCETERAIVDLGRVLHYCRENGMPATVRGLESAGSQAVTHGSSLLLC